MSGIEPRRICREKNPEIWFSRRTVDEAKRLCRACPAAALCLEETLDTERDLGHALKGIHAGLDEAERANVLSRNEGRPIRKRVAS